MKVTNQLGYLEQHIVTSLTAARLFGTGVQLGGRSRIEEDA